MVVDRDVLQQAVHEALRAWHAQSAPARTALDGLLLVQARREQLARDGNPLGMRLATNHVLLEALEQLARHDEQAAQVLNWRFPDNNTLLMVAHRLNVSEHTVSRIQRAAIEKLVDIIEVQEEAMRQGRVRQLEADLPPPTYTRLFGVAQGREELGQGLLERGGPRVVAVVGIGGIGKTALADAVTRDLIKALAFENVIWLRYDTRTMSGQALSSQHAFESLLDELAGRLAPERGTTATSERLAFVRGRLQEARHLVVIDNLEDEAAADFLLNHLADLAGPGKFLLTTRSRPQGQTAVRHISLPELGMDDAARLLRSYTADAGAGSAVYATDEDVARIYAVTGGNPLALKLVAGLLDLLPLDEVLAQLARSRPGPVEELYRHIYWQAWRTLGEAARRLLRAMPLVAESGADADYLKAISGLEDDAFWPALQQLRARSLLEVRGTLQEKRYGMHRLTETFVRTEIARWPED